MNLQELKQKIRFLLSHPPNRTIVSGPRWAGKRKTIREEIQEIAFVDFMEADGSMDGARAVQEFLRTHPICVDVRAVLVNGAKFSDAAQDAYLKICEDDTPFSSIIIVTDDRDSIRPALLSRLDTVEVFNNVESSDDFSLSVARGRPELLDSILSNLDDLKNLYSFLCDPGNRRLMFVPKLISDWSDLDDAAKDSVLATCEKAVRDSSGGLLIDVLRFVDALRSVPSANAEIHWWRCNLTRGSVNHNQWG